ncbi:MAG: putative lipid II flippase FtsW [Candidatus Nealsonbacteria bacterium CG_4_8_14_3_um_filter_39_7]|nr:MAG: putative lipid II flippase FtsW [Candidatus Nealsonbacteria bacterium CG_4_8_14_3_um_filter_39_7]
MLKFSAKKINPDYTLLGSAIALVFLGIIVLASVSTFVSQKLFGNTYHFLAHQLLLGLLPGLILGFLAFKIDLNYYRKYIPLLLLANLFLMLLVFLPIIGSSLGGASRWVHLGFISFQPSEFLKLTFILYLSSWLAAMMEGRRSVSSAFLPFIFIIIIISLFLVLQPDIGTLGIIVFSAVAMYFSASTSLWQTVLMILAGLGCLIALIKIAPYRCDRLLVFLKPETDPMGLGYHTKQALIAIGSGGIFGVGLGMSTQKYGLLPESISDSTFAVFAEETGFLGSILLIILFLLFLWRCFNVAKENKDKFSQLVAMGISSWIVFQGFINIGSMIGVLPLTGVPLPFISYGCSHLITELVAVGLLLNISKKPL